VEKYDIIHFEALGVEAEHLEEETIRGQRENHLPKDLKSLIVPDTVQEFLKKIPDAALPDIITTKTHSVLPRDYLSGTKKSIVTRSADTITSST
jgi:D-lactate dehydrogenase